MNEEELIRRLEELERKKRKYSDRIYELQTSRKANAFELCDAYEALGQANAYYEIIRIIKGEAS